jgi:peptidoglycan/LPS O-acetylase OafA/YrhL
LDGVEQPWLNLVPYLFVLVFLLYRYDLFVTSILIIFKRVIIATIFIWIILEQNFSERSYFKVSSLKLVSKLGKYTYGLYCLRTIAISIIVILLSKFGLNHNAWQLWFLKLPLAMELSILISYLSYTYFESRSLKLKNRFAHITK